jgi:putative Mg2+ transporter-C (MgtC) family protein
MDASLARVGIDLACALAAGASVGAERSFNGRSAGVRTHALVSLAAAGAMTVALQPQFPSGYPQIAQGVMTGVGFLGAGVIFKEGVSIQGLTTAAAIWAVAAIGVLFGLGLLGPGVLLTFFALVVLIGLRVVERILPRNYYAYATLVFERREAPDQSELGALLGGAGVQVDDISFAGRAGGRIEFRGTVVTMSEAGLRRIAKRLMETPGLVEFDLARLSK